MATKTATAESVATESTQPSASFLARMQARVEDTSMRRAITSFATACLNGGTNIDLLGLGINIKDLVRCQWKHEPTKENGEKYGYKLGKIKRGTNIDEVIYFPEFYAYIVDMSAKFIEFVGVKSEDPNVKELQPMTMPDGTVINPYDRLGVIYNADGSKGSGYDLYNELREQYPGKFTTRRFTMLILADANGNTLHDIPLMLSIKGGALRYFDEAMVAAQSRLGMAVSEIQGVQDASPLSIKGMRGFLFKFECEKGSSENKAGKSSAVTAIVNIGADINATNAEQYFSESKEEMLTAWSAANPNFISAYDEQIGGVLGHKIRASLEGSSVNDEQFLLPEQTFTEVA